ncbi:hypothetical protein VP1G_07184 [Cytospora mali]|uniref:Uncharacterized protein n=1 Tax=Cytospora mali TaxID=578113 RepID=A0A194V7P3_CYTMA|nr:hypothetical protein VP1G_07184 [Valsa mali var. pyri (nom. inval.)]
MRICLPRRCGLCRFGLDDYEEIVVYRENGVIVKGLQYNLVIYDREVTYITCHGACPYDELATGCHLGCAGFVSSNVCSALIKATSYQYEPLPTQDDRRKRWLRFRWSLILHKAFSLPVELGDQIAQFCLRELAITYATLSLRGSHSSDSCVNISSNKLWLHYTLFEGSKYVASITSQQHDDHGKAVLLSTPGASILYVAEDHLGIKDLLFAAPTDARISQEQPNIWWRTLELKSSLQLQSRTDGIKLRNMTVDGLNSVEQTLWKIPQPPTQTLRWDSLQNLHKSLHPLRMSVMDINSPGIFAYSVCTEFGIIMMHAHTPGERTDFYHAVPPRAVWHYMPVDSDEFITEIWKRQGLGKRELALMVSPDTLSPTSSPSDLPSVAQI